MNAKEWEAVFDRVFPVSDRCPWDNDGLMLCTEPDREIRRVVLTLDVTEDAVAFARQKKADAIVTHHPFLFRPLRTFDVTKGRCRLLWQLGDAGISVFSYHTRFDMAEGGVTEILCRRIGIEETRPFGPDGEKAGRIGDVPPMTATAFAAHVKERLESPSVCLSPSKKTTVSRVAVLGGAADDAYLNEALRQGADLFLCGDVSYNDMVDASIDGMNVVKAGHYETENPALCRFTELLSEKGVECLSYDCAFFTYF